MSQPDIVRVRDVMSASFRFIDGQATVKEALRLFKEKAVAALIVEKRHDDDEHGIVLVSDIAKQVLARDRAPGRVSVHEIMAKPVVSVPGNMDIRYCARLFDAFGLSFAPVVEEREITGIVSYDDIVLNGLAGLALASETDPD